MNNRAIFWFRRDLRLEDNRALYEACKVSREVVPVFVFDTNILNELKDKNDKRVYFIYETIQKLKQQLTHLESALIILHGDPMEEIPKLAQQLKIECVFTNKDYETYGKKRDDIVKSKLKQANIEFQSFKDQVIFEEDEIINGSGKPYKVFTPYKTAWMKNVQDTSFFDYKPHVEKLIKILNLEIQIPDITIETLGFKKTHIHVNPGRKAALEGLKSFTTVLDEYDIQRNRIDITGTSQISVYLRFGLVSIRELFRLVNHSSSQGAQVWKSELIWREFYQMILSQYPHVEKEPFKEKYKNLVWLGSESDFKKWCQGQTGFPIIDSAMRCLNETGWMHNRLRMIVASFLTKDLLVDYRKGEAYFAQKLLDFDLSANNGGWQWCASTGCDAQPYFRVFNPEMQSINCDPQALFIKKYCPELSLFSALQCHSPHKTSSQAQSLAKCKIGVDYPFPIVNHSEQKLKAIHMFKLIL